MRFLAVLGFGKIKSNRSFSERAQDSWECPCQVRFALSLFSSC